MIEYKGQLNEGVEAFGTEKTITANEVLRTCDTKALAREIHHQNTLIPEQVAEAVLENFCKAAVEKMAEGFAIQLNSVGGLVDGSTFAAALIDPDIEAGHDAGNGGGGAGDGIYLIG